MGKYRERKAYQRREWTDGVLGGIEERNPVAGVDTWVDIAVGLRLRNIVHAQSHYEREIDFW